MSPGARQGFFHLILSNAIFQNFLDSLASPKGSTDANRFNSLISQFWGDILIYDQHPKIGAIVNAYTVNATAFSVTGAALDPRTIPESYVFLREVNRVPYGVQFRDSRELARQVSPRRPIAILENDGVLVTGKNVLDAFDRLEVLESTAEALINSRPLGHVEPMPDGVVAELERKFFDE